MSNDATFIERRIVLDRRSMDNQRVIRDNRRTAISKTDKQISHATTLSAVFDFLCLMAVAAISLVVYIATGFYSGVTSTVGHVIFGGALFIYFLIMFRRGLGLGILGFKRSGK